MTEYLTTEDLLNFVNILKVGPLRDLGLLESAAARPQAIIFGEPAYPDDTTRAAALLHSLVKNHPLVDGNKRLGWFACVVFLDLNHLRPNLTDDEGFTLTLDVAQGDLELPEITNRLQVISIIGE